MLKNAHLASLGVNILFIILRFLVFRSSRASYLLYLILSSPAIAIQFWLEKIGRPRNTPNGDLKAGEDLDAKGLTEYLWDVLYWTWACVVLAALFGDKAWWAWVVIPLYSIWSAWTTFNGVRQGLGGMGPQGAGEGANGSETSNRQKKMEKRGGQRMQYR